MERKPIKCVEDFEVYQKAVKLFEDFLNKRRFADFTEEFCRKGVGK